MGTDAEKLDFRIQRWIYKQGWPDLRTIQKHAIEPILAADQDILISASTAAGKTEAAFLPALTAIGDDEDGFGILYISPLKALINDQYRRLELLCEALDMQVTPWHGDAPQKGKEHARKSPSGVLMITPESLEAMLVTRAGWVRWAFGNLKYVIIDEFHSFIGSERGQHLLSILTRLEHLTGRLEAPVPRIALSATLGELELVPAALRPNGSLSCKILTDPNAQSGVKVQVRGYLDPALRDEEDRRPLAEDRVVQDIYDICRGDSHLVFANSRGRTEAIAASLAELSDKNGVPNEFFPHHGSLARDLRHELESRLQKEDKPTTAICTMTLELGIDIGKVQSIVQVTPPHSVSSLRQRMGRSGRRGEPSVLRMLISEPEITGDTALPNRLRLNLVQSLAMVRLLIADKWFEPPDTSQYHFSTLFHQVLATTAQWGGIRADRLYALLCKQGPFQKVSPEQFKTLLHEMGQQEYLTQLTSGELTLGVEGERLVDHYTFYAVFETPEEYRIENKGRTIGTVPVESMLLPEQHIVFAGKRWIVLEVDSDKKVVRVEATKGGDPPRFGGGGFDLHDIIRQEMYRIYTSGEYRIETSSGIVDYLTEEARSLFQEGLQSFQDAELANNPILEMGSTCYMFPWLGDRVVNTLSAVLMQSGLKASSFGGIIEVQDTAATNVRDCLRKACEGGFSNEMVLAQMVSNKMVEKYDEYLPAGLLEKGYGRRMFDCQGAEAWVKENLIA
ncbi:DEAD/DEAH box helicase [Fodinicurvata halophila]|uniref:DEAD/DEAH box helicase n=1 Tax=Fodinicurvata halophila TaxID=1419723 RepID=A0ABV8UMY4_9PROT